MTASGALRLGAAPSRESIVFGPPLAGLANAIGERQFTIQVRRGVASTLHVMSNNFLIPVDITAEETEMGNVWLGTIALPDLERTADIDITLLNSRALRQTNIRRYQPGVTLIEVSGTVVLTFRSWPDKDDSPVHLFSKPGAFFKVPPGEYFVLPGWFFRSEDQVRLIDMVRNGSDLRHSGLPLFTVENGKINQLQLDAVRAYETIQTIVSGSR